MSDLLRPLRDQLIKVLDWQEARVGFEKATAGIPADRRVSKPAGFLHSAWDLVEHMRLAQFDLLDFCVNADYAHALKWPDGYWPGAAVPSDAQWSTSLARFTADRAALQAFVGEASTDLFATVPTGKPGQTHLRAVLLVIDHNSYHLGQLISLRQALGIWP